MNKIVRYFLVGGAAASIDFAIFAVFAYFLGLPWFPVAAGGFIVATTVNYELSIRHVFSSEIRFSRKYEVLLVFFVSMVGLAINQAALWIFIEVLAWNLLLAKVMATAIVFFWNFVLRHSFIFKETA